MSFHLPKISLLLGAAAVLWALLGASAAGTIVNVGEKGASGLIQERHAPEKAGLATKSASLDLGPLLGHVSSNQAIIWAKASGPANFALRISPQPDLTDGWNVKGPRLESAADFMGRLQITNLQSARRYHYCILLDGKAVMLPPYPSFTTAPAGDRGPLRFAFGSCVGYDGFDSAATWGDMATRTNFDLLLMLG